jgi:neutral ceramidase
MFVGTGREIINPEIGHHLCGYGDCYPNSGVHDDISVTALFLDDGARKALLLSYDLIGLVKPTQDRIRAAVSAATGVGEQCIFLACTHVHSAPDVIERHYHDGSPRCRADYLQRLQEWSAKAAAAAARTAEECQLRYNFTDVPENMNRRYNFPDRRFLYIPNNKQLLGQSREFVDRELGIVAFRKKGTQNLYKAVITNYTAHPLCVGNSSNLVSADYQGVIRRRVEETFAGCTCLTTTGAAGDNHPLMPESGFAKAEEMGVRLAQQVICRCYDSTPTDYDDQLRLAQSEVVLKYKDEATQRMLPESHARRQPLTMRGELATRVTLLGIGPVLLAGFPGEPVAELGAMLKWSSPFLKSYVLFTASDCLGYFPTLNQFYWGGYEPDTTPFVRGTGEQLVAKALDVAHELIRRQPLELPALESIGTDGHPR